MRSGSPFQPTPKGPGIFPPGSAAIGSHVPSGMHFANRHCPDENLLRQNWFDLTMNRSRPGNSNVSGPFFVTLVKDGSAQGLCRQRINASSAGWVRVSRTRPRHGNTTTDMGKACRFDQRDF